MKEHCSFPLSADRLTTYIFPLFDVFSLILNGLSCRMDNAEACFILSSRNEVDRMAAVRHEQTQIIFFPFKGKDVRIQLSPLGPSDDSESLGSEGLCPKLPPLCSDTQTGK